MLYVIAMLGINKVSFRSALTADGKAMCFGDLTNSRNKTKVKTSNGLCSFNPRGFFGGYFSIKSIQATSIFKWKVLAG